MIAKSTCTKFMHRETCAFLASNSHLGSAHITLYEPDPLFSDLAVLKCTTHTAENDLFSQIM